jgi:hypothetical protein
MYFVFRLFGFSGISVVSLFALLLGCLAIGQGKTIGERNCFSSFVSFGRKEFIYSAAFSILDKFIVI